MRGDLWWDLYHYKKKTEVSKQFSPTWCLSKVLEPHIFAFIWNASSWRRLPFYFLVYPVVQVTSVECIKFFTSVLENKVLKGHYRRMFAHSAVYLISIPVSILKFLLWNLEQSYSLKKNIPSRVQENQTADILFYQHDINWRQSSGNAGGNFGACFLLRSSDNEDTFLIV